VPGEPHSQVRGKRPKPAKPAQPIASAQRRIGVTGHELADLLAPVTVDEFMARYWMREALFVKGGGPKKLEALVPGGFERQDFVKAVCAGAALKLKRFGLWAGNHGSMLPLASSGPLPMRSIRADEMAAKLAGGDGLIAGMMSDPRIATLAVALKTQLQNAGEAQIGATASPGGTFVRAHCDLTSNIFIQASGRKRFRISPRPILRWPRDTIHLFADGTGANVSVETEPWEEISDVDYSTFREEILGPGDMVYFPAGTVHMTESLEDSVTIILGYSHPNFLKLISDALDEKLRAEVSWRYLPSHSAANPEEGKLPPDVRDFFGARLGDLRASLAGMNAQSLELNRHWQRLVADPGEDLLACLPAEIAPPTPVKVKQTDRLRLSSRLPVTFAAGTDETGELLISVFRGKQELSASGDLAHFLKWLLGAGEFVAAAASEFRGGNARGRWSQVREWLCALVDAGVVESVENA
jgi:hypothetical protein